MNTNNGKEVPRTLHEKIDRQKKFEQAQFQTMMEVYDHYRNGTFLSLDIVGSTKLKDGEDGVVVVDSFKAFHSFVLDRIDGSVSNVFSGDGVRCLFSSLYLRKVETYNGYYLFTHKAEARRFAYSLKR